MAVGSAKPDDVEANVQRVTGVLVQRHDAVPQAVIEQTVRACFADFRDAKVRDFVSVLVQRRATEQVRSMQAGDQATG